MARSKHRPRERRGQEFWQRAVEEQNRSELTQAEYCRRHKLALSTFQWWRRRLGTSSQVDSSGPDFVALRIRPAEPEPLIDDGLIEVNFPSGIQLRVPRGFDGQSLVEVLWALEATGSC